jgi:lysophospholipase L1-like esterase
MVLVPTYDLFELNANKYLYSDHFHPNQDGYERIAERIVQIMK